jgi:hypothetical protein
LQESSAPMSKQRASHRKSPQIAGVNMRFPPNCKGIPSFLRFVIDLK